MEEAAHTNNSIILPQFQIIRQILDLVPVRFAAAVVGEVFDLEAFLDQVVVEDGVGLAVFAREADFGRASEIVSLLDGWYEGEDVAYEEVRMEYLLKRRKPASAVLLVLMSLLWATYRPVLSARICGPSCAECHVRER